MVGAVSVEEEDGRNKEEQKSWFEVRELDGMECGGKSTVIFGLVDFFDR